MAKNKPEDIKKTRAPGNLMNHAEECGLFLTDNVIKRFSDFFRTMTINMKWHSQVKRTQNWKQRN